MNPAAPLSSDDVLCSEQDDVWQAHHRLIAEVAEDRIGVEGTPGTEDGPQPGGFPRLIPTGVFAVPNIGFSLLGDNHLGLDLLRPDQSPIAALFGPATERFTGPYYWHVRIRAQDVRERWPADNGMAALRRRLAIHALGECPDAPKASERPGFMWAHRALRLLAFGDADLAAPEGRSGPEAALGAVGAASRRLCDALAKSPDGTATGLRGHGASGDVKSDTREGIPASAFADPHQSITLSAWLTHGGDVPIDRFVVWREAVAPDWCEVLLPEQFVRELIGCAAPIVTSANPAANLSAPFASGSARRSGAPGRPSSADLAKREHDRRWRAKEASPRLADEAKTVSAWLASEHHLEPQIQPKAMENVLRSQHNGWKSGKRE